MESKTFFWFTKKDPKRIIQNIYIWIDLVIVL